MSEEDIDYFTLDKVGIGEFEDERLDLLHSLGMPQNRKRIARLMPGTRFGVTYSDFRIEMFGVAGPMPDEIKVDKQSRVGNIQISRHKVKPSFGAPGLYASLPLADGTFVEAEIWMQRIYMKGIGAYLEEVWDSVNTTWMRAMWNLPGDESPVSIKRLKRLVDGLPLLLLSIKETRSGRPRKATVDPQTIPFWSRQYDDALKALQSELSNRGLKQLKKYPEPRKIDIFKRAFTRINSNVAEALAKYSSLSDVALRYTGWHCSQIEIGTWESTQLRDVLRESDRINGIVRKGNRRT